MAINYASSYAKYLEAVEASILNNRSNYRLERPTKPVSDLDNFMVTNYVVLASSVALTVMVILTIYEATYRTIAVYLGLAG